MLDVDEELLPVLRTSHTVEYRVWAFYAGTLRQQIPVTSDGRLSFNGDQVVQCSGSVYLAKDQESLIPKGAGDVLAPYGQELRIDRVDKTGAKEWVTTLGQLRIQKLPSMRERYKKYPNGVQLVGWSAQVDVQDRFSKIQGDDFLWPESPQSGATAWGEIQRLSPVPVVQDARFPDVAVPGSLTAYPDSRMEAITTLFAVLGANPHLTRLGSLTARRKDAWLTETTPVFEISGVIDMDDSLSNDLYNAVKVSSSAGGNDAYSVRQVDDLGDPLYVNGPFGRRVFTQSSPIYETQESLDAAAETILARVSRRQSKTVTVTCLPQPHLELGDYIRATDTTSGRQVDGEITSIDAPLAPTASWRYGLIVAESR